MKSFIYLIGFVCLTWQSAIAQDCGKIIISNASKTDPGIVVSLNGVRLNNDYTQSVTFRYVDENAYRVKILQAGSSTPLSFTISSEARYVSAYLLVKDNVGRYSLLLQSKSLMLSDNEPEPAVATPAAVVPTATRAIATPTKTPEPVYQAPVAIGEAAFQRKYDEVKAKSFDDEKMERIKEAFEYDYLNTSQVMDLMKLFSFDDKRMAAAKFCYKKTVDKENFYKTYDLFSFPSSKSQMKEWVNKNKGK
ncbi:MAG: DUF4476 domain-containing protein [Bacteroidia bacterium]|nr:DUF4476 domain-containing protein [Bacteroidia bacterium]